MLFLLDNETLVTGAIIGVAVDGATDVKDALIEETNSNSIVEVEVIDLTEIDDNTEVLKVVSERDNYIELAKVISTNVINDEMTKKNTCVIDIEIPVPDEHR